MNYYEELGLAVTASTEEIQQAYRRLSRLLHPDRHPDPELKQLAECQMRRLNSVHEILTDQDRRRRYDLETSSGPLVAFLPLLSGSRMVWPHWLMRAGWLATAMLGVAAISWYVTGERMRHVVYPAVAHEKESVASPRAARPARRAAPAPRTSSPLPDPPANLYAGAEIPALRPGHDPALLADTLAVPAPRDVPLASSGASAFPPAPSDAAAIGFSGTWLYLPPRIPSTSALYPPEYIEAVITEQSGLLRGKYRARYRVLNRAISPDVNFSFEGPAGERTVTVPWRGGGGASGEIQLRLLSETRLELIWSAVRLGGDQALTAGTAVLVRGSARF